MLVWPGMLSREVSRDVQLSIQHDADDEAPPLPKGVLTNVWVRQDPGRICHASPQQLSCVEEQQACNVPGDRVEISPWPISAS